MKRLCLTPLFFFIIYAFAFAQDDCRTQDSLILVNFYNDYDFKAEFRWNIESPMNEWYGVTLNEAGCVERLELSGVLKGYAYCCMELNAMSQLAHVDLSNNDLNRFPDMSTAPQLTYVNVANNNLEFSDLELLPLNGAELVYAPQAMVDELEDVSRIFINTNEQIDLQYYIQADYVWYKDDIAIGTTRHLELTNIQASDAGVYRVDITNENFPDLTLQTIPLTVTVGGCRERDSLALVDIYKYIEFTSEVQQWDFSQPLDSWYGLTLTPEGCLERLDLSGVLGEGYFYSYLTGNLMNLSHLDLSDNDLRAMSSIQSIPSLEYLNIKNNRLDFNDLYSVNIYGIETALYTPQQPVSVNLNPVIAETGSNRELLVDISTNGDRGYVFRWFKDSTQIGIFTDENTFELQNLQADDSGTYICEITSSVFPDLTLYSPTIEVSISSDMRLLDSLILVEFYESVTFKPEYNWDLSQPIDTWHGVILNDADRIQELILPNALTGGELPKSIQQLEDLEVLNLSNNNLTGRFLVYTDFDTNLFPKLRHADLSHNKITDINLSVFDKPGNL